MRDDDVRSSCFAALDVLLAKHGPDVLVRVAKVHFKTAHEIAPDHYAYVEKPFFRRVKKAEA